MSTNSSILFWVTSLFLLSFSYAQPQSWLQRADYVMEVDMDVNTYQYAGLQKLTYTNNSPDTLNRVFYHMYFNAFQPGSEMDMRLQAIADPDSRMMQQGKSRIAELQPDEIGFLKAQKLTQNGVNVQYELEGTILVVSLAEPILPGTSTLLEMQFEGQVPVQIRRSGRNNTEGIALSMSQWYPKIAEFDHQGWHDDPYIGREFHGVWGDYDVKITLDKDYVIGGTGYLQNPEEIGHGYAQLTQKQLRRQKDELTWHFIAPRVHDFMWAADPDYLHDIRVMENGTELHFFYQDDPDILENWKNLQPKTQEAMKFFNANLGSYPYKQYSIVQGGDGGMEYAMSTLITGKRSFGSLVGVMIHELAHSWFQHVLATNEARYPWMDEGFTDFIGSLCENQIMSRKEDNPFINSYNSYFGLAASGKEQPQTTHSDRYALNAVYGATAYSKGAVFLAQLGYVMGQEDLMKTLRKYYADFKFKHPTPVDFIRTAERVSGMHLDWYLTDWTQTTNTIDYGIASVEGDEAKTLITLERVGLMPMPVDLLVVYKDGSRESFYMPLRMMRGEKPNPYPQFERTILDDWPWAQSEYQFTLEKPLTEIQAVVIDPTQLMADVDAQNNLWLSSPE